jgi:hypothetical protein
VLIITISDRRDAAVRQQAHLSCVPTTFDGIIDDIENIDSVLGKSAKETNKQPHQLTAVDSLTQAILTTTPPDHFETAALETNNQAHQRSPRKHHLTHSPIPTTIEPLANINTNTHHAHLPRHHHRTALPI